MIKGLIIVCGILFSGIAVAQVEIPYMDQILFYIDWACRLLTSLCVLATIVVRLPFMSAYKDTVDGVTSKAVNAVNWLPTIGINPRTKKLEEALKDMQVKNVSP